MEFVSGIFLVFLAIGLVIYYSTPKKWQPYVLLLLSVLFYCSFSVKLFLLLLLSVIISYAAALGIASSGNHFGEKTERKKTKTRTRFCLFFAIGLLLTLLAGLKYGQVFGKEFLQTHLNGFSILIPVGISFYTLQMISYLADVYHGICAPIQNLAHYVLYITYFPQILQGPIPRTDALMPQLLGKHDFDYCEFVGGFELLLWGYFQKMVIADRANIMVNRLFGEYEQYPGFYMMLAACLYSIQLYTDFNGCVCIAKGCSEMFGIHLSDNFHHPYFATSVQDFWRRWHISLSSWLKDYVYIPLGGNQKGKLRKYGNILITFAVSGFWHGLGLHFLVWGMLHGIYQVMAMLLMPLRNFLVRILGIDRKTFSHTLMKQMVTFCLVALAWVFFRADSVRQALTMIKSMFTTFNPWILWDGSLYMLGLNPKNVGLLFLSIVVLWAVSMLQERFCIRQKLQQQGIVFRYLMVLAMSLIILIFGIYGPGYDATAFIYGGF